METIGSDHPAFLAEEPAEVLMGAPADTPPNFSVVPPTDNAAPFGRKVNGEPKKSNRGRPPGGGSRKPPSGPKTQRSAPAPGRKAPTAARARTTNYTEAIAGLLDIPIMLGRLVPSPAVQLDVAAIYVHKQSIAEAGNVLVNRYPKLAPWLDKAVEFGPLGAKATAAVKPLMQIMENHRLLPSVVTQKFGAVPADQLMVMVQRQVTQDMRAGGLSEEEIAEFVNAQRGPQAEAAEGARRAAG